ncbi:MAG: M16 family metallopeptidase [Bacteroidia bacterium]
MNTLDRKTPPEYKDISRVNFINPTTYTLSNGLKINVLSGGSQDIVKIDFIFNAGTWHQKSPLIASSTNNLMKEGTKNFSSFEIIDGIDQYGAFLQTNVDFDNSNITLYSLNKHLEKVLVYVQDIIFNPTFEQKEFDIYKNNSLEKFKVSLEKVSYVARKESMKQIFGADSPYGVGAELIDFINLNKKEVIDFHRHNYQLSNCEVIISGKVSDNCISLLEKYFGGNTTSKAITSNKEASTTTLSNEPDKIYVEKKNALQSAIRISKQFPNKLHTDYFGLQILNTILGGYFGSRLMKNIREDKGYTYGISSGILSLQHGGFFYISTEVGSDVTKSALDEIYKEINLLQTEKISDEELSLVRNYLMGKILKSCDGPFNMAEMFENVYFYGLNYDFYNQYIQKIKTITSEELMNLANKYLVDLKETVVGKL